MKINKIQFSYLFILIHENPVFVKHLIIPILDISHSIFDQIFMIINDFHDVDILFGRLRA